MRFSRIGNKVERDRFVNAPSLNKEQVFFHESSLLFMVFPRYPIQENCKVRIRGLPFFVKVDMLVFRVKQYIKKMPNRKEYL